MSGFWQGMEGRIVRSETRDGIDAGQPPRSTGAAGPTDRRNKESALPRAARALRGMRGPQFTLTSICLGFGASVRATWMVTTPSLHSADTRSSAASLGREKLRVNEP
jgi:hypothetical protein